MSSHISPKSSSEIAIAHIILQLLDRCQSLSTSRGARLARQQVTLQALLCRHRQMLQQQGFLQKMYQLILCQLH